MTNSRILRVILLASSLPASATAQLLGGDVNFPVINEIRWEMTLSEARQLCESHNCLLSATDSTVVFQPKIFNSPARAKLQFDHASRLPRMLEVALEKADAATRDTVINYFTRINEKSPLMTTREKNALIFTIKMEVASWRSNDEMVNVISMMKGSNILGVNILITKATLTPKP